MASNRDALFAKINRHADACLARPAPQLPRLQEWLRPSPGIIFDTNTNAPPIIIGFVCQAMMGITSEDDARAEAIGKMVQTALSGNTGVLTGGIFIGSAGRTPSGTVGGAVGGAAGGAAVGDGGVT